MINLRDVAYVRLGTRSLQNAEDFATKILGLQVGERVENSVYLRSDQRAYTLSYFEGDPSNQTAAFVVDNDDELNAAADVLDKLGYRVHRGSSAEAELRKVKSFIAFGGPSGTQIELVTYPAFSGKRYYGARDAGITGFNHLAFFSHDPVADEQFWTTVCNARVSDWVGDIPLMRINAIHHTLALVKSSRSGIQHINHQVETVDDIMKSYYMLRDANVPIIFGPGRHPTSGARFLYFTGPDGVTFEYSCGVGKIEDEANHVPRRFTTEPTSMCMWGSKPNLEAFVPGA
ncbi:VOC family protein [Ferribacterium limneticum]|uniref:VOC family protein n=1 Tax=Ferribacterium limneticum TaxID=76259 RepID=UPI001CFC0A92|nr:VOC family protein [Ferribacterium limneticum]UCV17751.1 VOC family protein [Ferribacterium limneticum]